MDMSTDAHVSAFLSLTANISTYVAQKLELYI